LSSVGSPFNNSEKWPDGSIPHPSIAPEGKWFKNFGSFTLCGEGELVKTVLLPGQIPDGTEIM
jgi:hypothetical protein